MVGDGRRVPERISLPRPVGHVAIIREQIDVQRYTLHTGSRMSSNPAIGIYIGSIALAPGTRVSVDWREESRVYRIIGPVRRIGEGEDSGVIPIAASGDDGHFGWGTSPTFTSVTSQITLNYFGSGAVGLWTRFVVPVNQGAPITSAFVRFRLQSGVTGGEPIKRIDADNEVDAPNPSSRVDALARRNTGLVETVWNTAITGSAGDIIDTPDIAATLQAVIDLEDWVAGNHVCLYILAIAPAGEPPIDFRAVDDGSNTPPELHIDIGGDPATPTEQLDAPDVLYTPSIPGDWPDPDPTDVQEALDDLATRSRADVREFSLDVFDADVAVSVEDGVRAFSVPAALDGFELTAALASVHTKGITGTTDVMIRRRRGGSDADMLSTPVTIGDEFFAADGSIDGANDDVATGDQVYVDVDAVHSGTAPNGLSAVLTFTKP